MAVSNTTNADATYQGIRRRSAADSGSGASAHQVAGWPSWPLSPVRLQPELDGVGAPRRERGG